MRNNGSRGDVTFLVGEHIEGVCLHRSSLGTQGDLRLPGLLRLDRQRETE